VLLPVLLILPPLNNKKSNSLPLETRSLVAADARPVARPANLLANLAARLAAEAAVVL
jgi:hypothetical protein